MKSAEKAADLGPGEVTGGCEERQKWLGREPNILWSAKWVTFEMLFHLEVLPFGLILSGSAASVSAQAAPVWTEAKTHLCPRASSSPYPPHFLPPLLLLSEGLPARLAASRFLAGQGRADPQRPVCLFQHVCVSVCVSPWVCL